MATPARIRESWNIRKGLIDGILNRGETLIESLELIPETRKSIAPIGSARVHLLPIAL